MFSFSIGRWVIVAAQLLSSFAFGQSPLDGFNPDVDGPVYTMALQADGKSIIGGSFVVVGGLIKSNLARLNVDGTVDATFNSGPFSTGGVRVVAIQADRKILVGGDFVSLGGASSTHLVRLNTNGSVDVTFNASANGSVLALALQPDGKIIVGGSFTLIGGYGLANIARLNPDGSADLSFNPGASSWVSSLLLQQNGKIVVGGAFATLAGQPRSFLGRLNSDGTLDTSFILGTDNPVLALASQVDGKILVGGRFLQLGGQSRTNIGRLNANGTLDSSFNPNANDWVYSIAMQTDGKILLGGEFTRIGLGAPVRNHLARLNPDGTPDVSFSPGTDGTVVYSVLPQLDGNVLVAGDFATLGGQSRNHVGRIYPDGSVDATFSPNPAGVVYSLADRGDGRVLIGGGFDTVSGVGRTNLAQVRYDGSLDVSFNPGANSNLFSVLAHPDGKVLVGGQFTVLAGQPRNFLGRLNGDGSLDASFNTDANDWVRTLAVQNDGKILVGGHFTSLGGQNRSRLGRLNADGSLDNTFNPGADNLVLCLAVQNDGKILVGGFFNSLGGVARTNLGRLNADGSVDLTFNPGANSSVLTLALQADDKILVGGFFTQVGGQARNYLGRLNSDGGPDVSFNPGVNDYVRCLAVQLDGKLLVGGQFTTLGALGRTNIGRLNPDGSVDALFNVIPNSDVKAIVVQADGKTLIGGNFGVIAGQLRGGVGRLASQSAALQSLTIDPAGASATWNRSGGGPELTRVSFELSYDGTAFFPLGSPTRFVGGWRLNGLSLPGGELFYLRARGRFAGGEYNGSSGLIELITQFYRNAAPPTITALSASTAVAGSLLTISGSNFNPAPADNIVYFGAVRAMVVSASPTNLVVIVPLGASYGPISVTVGGLTEYSSIPFVPAFGPAYFLAPQSFASSFKLTNLPPFIGVSSLAAGDLDGDGRPDLVVGLMTNSVGVGIYRNIEPGGDLGLDSFEPPILLNAPAAAAVALADLDGDGLLDIVALAPLNSSIVVFRNTSLPDLLSFDPPLSFPTSGGSLNASSLAIADLDGDGLPDVIATSIGSNSVAVLRNLSTIGGVNLAPRFEYPAGFAPVSVAVSDLDGDGKPDLLVANGGGASTRTFSILRNASSVGNLGPGSFESSFGMTNAVPASTSIAAADFDRDGKPDIVLTTSNRVAVYRNISSPGALAPASFALPANLPSPLGPRGLAVADLDGDGRLEFICGNTNTPGLSAFWNISTPGSLTSGSFAPLISLPAGFNSIAVAAADFDLDGKPDLVAVGNGPATIGFWRNRANEPSLLINTIEPPGNPMTVTNSATVQIANRFTNGPVFYTLDGSPPGLSSPRYTNTLVVTESVIIRILAFTPDLLFSAETPPFNLIVIKPPVITLQPQGRIVSSGADVLFTVAATGTAPLAYQWRKNGIDIAGANSSTLLLTNVNITHAAGYSVRVSNAYGSATSTNAILTVLTAPTITGQPSDVDTGEGANVTLTAAITGAGPIVYQWRRNGVNIAGATNSTLTLTNLQLRDGATYTIVASGQGGTIISAPAEVRLVSVPFQDAGDDFLSATPLFADSGSVSGTNSGATREFGEPQHAGKSGSNSVWYTWTPINSGIATFATVGSTFDTLLGIYIGSNLTNLTTVVSDDDSGGFLASKVSFNVINGVPYRIAVDGFDGDQGTFILKWSLERTNAQLPIITCHPQNQTVLQGGIATFSVTASGPNLSYRWLFNGAIINGATNAVLVRTNVQVSNIGFYTARVIGSGNRSVDSRPALLEIGPFFDLQSKEKPDDIYPPCSSQFAPSGGFAPNAVASTSVAMGSIGFQSMVTISSNNVADCRTTECEGIPSGTRYLELTPAVDGTFVLDTSGSTPHTRMWICAKGLNNLDLTRTYVDCDTSSAPDGRSQVRFSAQGGRSYQAWIAKLDSPAGPLQLNWKLGLPPLLNVTPSSLFVPEGMPIDLNAVASNIVAPGVDTPLPAPTLQWYFNGQLVRVGTRFLTNATPATAGRYTIIASNVIGVTSLVIPVEVYGNSRTRTVSTGTANIEIFAADSQKACPGSATTYQWNFNGQPMQGENAQSLRLSNVSPGDAGLYSVTVHNCAGAATYNASTLAVTMDVGLKARVLAGGHVLLSWRAAPRTRYLVQSQNSLGSVSSPGWTSISGEMTTANASLSFSDPSPLSSTSRYYRIVLLPPFP